MTPPVLTVPHIERLRQIALLQKSRLEHLIAIHAKKCAEPERLKGKSVTTPVAMAWRKKIR